MTDLQTLFPGVVIKDDEIEWLSNEYVWGYKGKNRIALRLDGDFSPAQLRALADWAES